MEEKIQYSSILQDFAKPLLYANDTNDQFVTKMKVIELIWNYCIAKEFSLPIFDKLHEAITTQNEGHPEMKQLFKQFVEIKKMNFDKFKNYIVNTELRISKDGNKTVYVESISPLHYKEIINGAIGI